MTNDNCRKFNENQIMFCTQPWIVEFSRPVDFGEDRLRAVSYTHLDVYKRQFFFWFFFFRFFFFPTPTPSSLRIGFWSVTVLCNVPSQYWIHNQITPELFLFVVQYSKYFLWCHWIDAMESLWLITIIIIIIDFLLEAFYVYLLLYFNVSLHIVSCLASSDLKNLISALWILFFYSFSFAFPTYALFLSLRLAVSYTHLDVYKRQT